jgi:hypothetical protein
MIAHNKTFSQQGTEDSTPFTFFQYRVQTPHALKLDHFSSLFTEYSMSIPSSVERVTVVTSHGTST